MRWRALLSAAVLVAAAVPLSGFAWGDEQDEVAAPTVAQDAAGITVDNGIVKFHITSTSDQMDSLVLRGHELLANGGVGYDDANGSFPGGPPCGAGYFVPKVCDPATLSYRVGSDFVDVSINHQPTKAVPFTFIHHYVLRGGESGFHYATEVAHDASQPAAGWGQTRFVLRTDPNLFTTAFAPDDPGAIPWRKNGVVLPTPQQLTFAEVTDPIRKVQDATDDLFGLGSAYPKRFYTKYDMSAYEKLDNVHGLTGGGFGVWVEQPNHEAKNGGPLKQNLGVHTTTTTPLVLNVEIGAHYGSSGVNLAAGQAWDHLYGPYFLYLNQGTDGKALYRDAQRYANLNFDRNFYDRLNLGGWVASDQRSEVSGRIQLASASGDEHERANMKGTTVVLSDNNTYWQDSAVGYQYWADTNAEGEFTVKNVRPGTYRLSAYKSGVFYDYAQDNVVVGTDQRAHLGNVRWSEPDVGRTVWQIGTPNHVSTEFLNGPNERTFWWPMEQAFLDAIPNAAVDYAVGKSTPSKDWNYVQYQVMALPVPLWNPDSTGNPKPVVTRMPDWKVEFNQSSAPDASGTVSLTVALAAMSGSPLLAHGNSVSYDVSVNGTALPAWVISAAQFSATSYRSGGSGREEVNTFTFPASLLQRGNNVITFNLNGTSTTQGFNAVYDALNLSVK